MENKYAASCMSPMSAPRLPPCWTANSRGRLTSGPRKESPWLNSWNASASKSGGRSCCAWVLGLRLNTLFPNLPLGTLAANVIAGYVIGVAVAWFARFPGVSMEWRLFVITGLMGGLSTFSTFSAEVVAHLQQGRYGWAAGEIAIHVTASVVMTILGIATVSFAR